MKRNLTSTLALSSAVAALALGATACEIEEGTGGDPGIEDPLMDDTGTLDDTGTGTEGDL
jgi:hypothetical protein